MIKIIYGDEPYLIDVAVSRATEEKEEISFSEISNEILLEMDTPSFFGDKVCILKVQTLKSIDTSFIEQAQCSDGHLLVIVENIDKRLSVFKQAEKLGVTKEYRKLSLVELRKFICDFIKGRGKTICGEVVDAFIERINYENDETCNLYQVEFSMIKLLAVADSENISLAHVELAIEDNSGGNVFNIVTFLKDGKLQELEREIYLIPEGEGLKVLGLVLSKFRLAYKANMFERTADAAKAIGCSNWAIVKFPVSDAVLSKCIDILVSAMQDIKHGAGEEITVRYTLLQLYHLIQK